jgi:hypothetical protein
MDSKTLTWGNQYTAINPAFKQPHSHSTFLHNHRPRLSRFNYRLTLSIPQHSRISRRIPNNRLNPFITSCLNPDQAISIDEPQIAKADDASLASVSSNEEAEAKIDTVESNGDGTAEFAADESIWNQMAEIVKFSGPATGLWLCGPLMSLIDTIVIGQSSSIELAALGPGTVLCDYMSYTFMFLSIATSNMVATSLARRGKDEVQHQISILLFIGLACGVLMFLFTRFWGAWALTAFTGGKNVHIIPAANTYVQVHFPL